MTDKEWKELCDWANYHRAMMISENYFSLYVDEDTSMGINCCGDIKLNKNFQGLKVIMVIAENRTPAQIKAIITNLL